MEKMKELAPKTKTHNYQG